MTSLSPCSFSSYPRIVWKDI